MICVKGDKTSDSANILLLPHTNRHIQIQIKHAEIEKLLLRRFFTAGGNRRRLERSIQRWNTFTLHYIYVGIHLDSITFMLEYIYTPLHLRWNTFTLSYIYVGIHLDSITFTLEYIYTPLPSIDNWASRKTLVH